CAAGRALLAPNDAGIVRLEAQNDSIYESKTFPDTEPFVSAESKLFGGPDGLYVVGSQEIRRLVMG
ncbi:MAG: hypothetical protein ABIQ44_02455, partial [Chloroflexia bacterium]